MPINYAPPQPYNPGVSAAYGAAEEFNKLAPTLEAHQANQAHNFAQMYLAAGQSRDQMVGIAAQRGVQEQLAAANINQRNQEMMAQRDMHTESLDAHTANIQLQGMLQGQAVSQQEQLRMQRMQSAIGDVMSDETMTPQMQRDLVMQLKTGIDPVRQRLEQQGLEQQQKLQQQELSMATEKAKAQSLHNNIMDDMRSGNMKKWQQDLYDEEGHHIGSTVPDGKGGIHVLPPAKKEKEEKAVGGLKAADVAKIHHDVTEATNKRATMIDKSDPDNPKLMFPGLQDPAARAKEIKSEFDARINEVKNHFAPPEAPSPGLGDQFMARFGPSANIGGSPQAAPEAPQGPTSLKNPFKDQGATAELQPFKLDKPETQTPQQRVMSSALVESADLFKDSPHLSAEEKKTAQSHVDVLRQLLEDFGSYNAMPQAKKDEYTFHTEAIRHYTKHHELKSSASQGDTRSSLQKLKDGDLITRDDIGFLRGSPRRK